MKLRKFVAADVREALAQVKQALGDDAVIVTTRPVRRGALGEGVEVTAAIDTDEDQAELPPPPRPSAAPSTSEPTARELERLVAPLRGELAALRALIAPLVAGSQPQPPAPAATAAQRVSPGRPPRFELAQPSDARRIALIGPTGAGKTTTIAKLAARAALVERRSVAVITLDTFRVGAEEQMRAYTDLIGCELLVVPSPDRLAATLATLARVDRVFIDTAGRGPRDGAQIRALDVALAALPEVEVHLTLPAATTAEGVDALVERHATANPARFLFTKCDEAIDASELAAAPARHRMPVTWIATGQRVPEDLTAATEAQLRAIARGGFDAALEVA
jgi:flagellar biosynthesis protein FlhF